MPIAEVELLVELAERGEGWIHLLNSEARSGRNGPAARRLKARVSGQSTPESPAEWLENALWLTDSFKQTLGEIINDAEAEGLTTEDLQSLKR